MYKDTVNVDNLSKDIVHDDFTNMKDVVQKFLIVTKLLQLDV